MGSPTTEVGRNANIEVQYEVTFTNGFYLGKYEVTQAQYKAVMTGNEFGLSASLKEWSNHPNSPVEKVSWDDIQLFLTHLNTKHAERVYQMVGLMYCLLKQSGSMPLPCWHFHGV